MAPVRLEEAEVMGLAFPFGGGGDKKPSCRPWAHPGSQTRPSPSLLAEFLVAEASGTGS